MRKAIYALIFSISILCVACDPDNVPGDLIPYLTVLTGRDLDLTGPALASPSDRNEIIDAALHQAPGRVDLRLPNYSYFQGLIQVENHLVLAGQVRVVGGVLGGVAGGSGGVSALYSGAMVTANPGAFEDAGDSLKGGPAGVKTRVRKWEEIPNL
jgi:hypothetical protein